ncbi:MAG: hypothetical protein BWX73_01777 [Lentisphaerae bacterium ADurb.Bin082]|nr:MAG: hypothetical protein BWX73_01777 [Lentisphaerae bacterium ADurb.Bin082]
MQRERHHDAIEECRLACRRGNFWRRDRFAGEGSGLKSVEAPFVVQNFLPFRLLFFLIDDPGVVKEVQNTGHPWFLNRWRRPHEEDSHVVAVVKSQAAQRSHAGGNADGRKVDVAHPIPGQHVWRQGGNALGENALAQAIVARKALVAQGNVIPAAVSERDAGQAAPCERTNPDFLDGRGNDDRTQGLAELKGSLRDD